MTGRDSVAPLAGVARLAAGVAHVPWFSAVGEPLTAADESEARLYLYGLGIDGVRVLGVASWADARRAADHPDWDRRWWDAEEALRTALTRAAEDAFGRAALHRALTAVGDAATDIVQGAAAVAAARSGVANPALIKSAAGAATLACHHAALARATQSGADHPFTVKFRLFQAGRWPLGIVDGDFYLF